MAADSSVVDLCTVADDAGLDAATAARFFRDGGGGAGAGGATMSSSFSWPEAGRTPSRLSDQGAVQAIFQKYKIPADYTPLCLDGRWAACQTPPEPERSAAVFVYAGALEAGMRIPLHGFYVEVLGHYGLAPSQLTPDAWRHLAAFVLLSKDAGVEPSLPAFRCFFTICTGTGDSVGWHHFKCRHGRHGCLFNGKMPKSSSDPDWKSRFFLLRSPPASPWPCPVRWGKPTRAAVRMPVVNDETRMVMEKLLDRAGSSGIDVMQFLSRRSPPVAPPAPQQKHKPIKSAAAPPPLPLPTSSPPPPEEPTRKRKSFSVTNTLGQGLVDCIAEASELAKKAMAELDGKGKELLVTRAEVGQFKEALSAANARHVAEVADLQKQSTLLAEHLKKQHAAAVARLKEEHATEIGRLADEHRKAAQERATEEQLKKEHAIAVAQLIERFKKEHAVAVAQLIERFKKEQARLNVDHASVVDRLKEEHAAEVARMKDAADKALMDTKKKIMLRLFPTLDVSLLERPKLKGDLAAAAGTPKGEARS